MGRIHAVIFDSDGTLLNTPEVILAAYGQVAQLYGLRPPTHDEIMAHMGKGLLEIYQGLFPNEDGEKLVAANNRFVLESMNKIHGFDGLTQMLDDLQSLGLKLGVITGGTAKVHHILAHNGIEQYFGSIVHSERIKKQKPDPEGLLLAASELGAHPNETIMVGDMRYDILAGKNAAVRATIGLTHGFGTLGELEAAGADYIVSSLLEVAPIIQTLI